MAVYIQHIFVAQGQIVVYTAASSYHLKCKIFSFSSFLFFLRLEGSFYEVMSVDFEIDNFISLKSTQTIRWQIEYPVSGLQAEAFSHIYISQRDIRGIVPLAEVRLCQVFAYYIVGAC